MPRQLNVLVVDDSAHVQRQLADALKDHKVEYAQNAAIAKQKILAAKRDICFIDLDLGDKNDPRAGLPVIAAAKRGGAYAVVLTNFDDKETKDLATRLGCDEFHSKREGIQAVASTLNRFLNKRKQILGEELYRYALEYGLYSALDLVTDLIIGRNLDESKGVGRQVLRNLNITNSVLYKSLRGGRAPARRRIAKS
jgi:DNA-binding NtrC family response regulator